MPRHLTIDDAATALGVSRRTVERRLKAGTLPTIYVAGRRLVVVPDTVFDATESDVSATRHDTATDATVTDLAVVRAQLAEVTAERDFLRATVSRLLDTQGHLLAQLPPGQPEPTPQPEPEPPRRRRWPWQRG